MKNKQYDLDEHIRNNIRYYSEIKIESLDFEIIDKIKDENNHHLSIFKYPQNM